MDLTVQEISLSRHRLAAKLMLNCPFWCVILTSMPGITRRSFLRTGAATAAALALGPRHWGWAQEGSPFGPLQDDAIIRLPEGFSYKVIAETHQPMLGGRGPFPRPPFPDLNVLFPQPGGKILLSTSHEIPAEFPFFATNPAGEEYDPVASGAITSLLLNPDLSIAESAYNAGGMITNCSGSGTPWGTVLTGEEAVTSFENDHGYVWEVDVNAHTKTRLDACGRFDHETAVVDPVTGYVYLTEDAGSGLIYRMRPNIAGTLSAGGVLEAYNSDGTWVTIDDPSGSSTSTKDQGVAKGALRFRRPEGGLLDGRLFYFTESADVTAGGRVWRLNVDTGVLELYSQGGGSSLMTMPDNIALDVAGNLFICEDRADASPSVPNQVLFIDRATGSMAVFAELVHKFWGPQSFNIADEPTGPVFTPNGEVMFLNLQREFFGITIAITGPFASSAAASVRAAALPRAAQGAEMSALSSLGLERFIGIPLAAMAGLVALRRRGENVYELPEPLEEIASSLGAPPAKFQPKRP